MGEAGGGRRPGCLLERCGAHDVHGEWIDGCCELDDGHPDDRSASPPTGSSGLAATPSVRRRTDAELPGPEAATLQSTVDDYVAAQTTDFSVVAVDLTTGERAEHLADRVVLSASLYKLFVARELLRQLDDGKIRATDPRDG